MNINDTKVNQECNSSEQNKPIVYWDGKHFEYYVSVNEIIKLIDKRKNELSNRVS